MIPFVSNHLKTDFRVALAFYFLSWFAKEAIISALEEVLSSDWYYSAL